MYIFTIAISIYLINFGLYQNPKIPIDILVCSKKETINYEYDLVATRFSTITKELEKSTKCNLQLTPFG